MNTVLYDIHSRTEFARVWPARKCHLVQAVAGRIYEGGKGHFRDS